MEENKKIDAEAPLFFILGIVGAGICLVVSVSEYIRGFKEDALNFGLPMALLFANVFWYFANGIRTYASRDHPEKRK